MIDAHTFFEQVDSMDPHAVGKFFAEDAVMVFGNGEPMVGRDVIVAGNGAFMLSIKKLSHRLVNEWDLDTTTIVESEVTYLRRDDSQVTIPAVTVLHADGDDDLITHAQVFYDPAPIFAP